MTSLDRKEPVVMTPPPQSARSRVADITLAVLFLTAISLPIVVQTLGLDVAGLAENRKRTPRPELTLQRRALAKFPGRFEAYFNDSFGLRSWLIRGNNLAKVALLGVSTSSKVIIGKRGWLFYGIDGAVDDLHHSRPLTQEALRAWAEPLEERREWLARRGIHYLVMFAPNKHTIYPELIPGRYKTGIVARETRYDQLAEYLRAHTQVELVDLRTPLLKAKSQGRLYFRRDTHWNDRGAFVAYETIIGALSHWFPNLQPMPRSAFRQVGIVRPDPDLSIMLGLADDLPDQDYVLKPTLARHARQAEPGLGLDATAVTSPEKVPVARESPDPSLPRAVIFRDSFTSALIPFLSEHFARSLYVWHCGFDPAIIEREHPQVVIEETVERMLWAAPPVSGLPESMIARK
jgi:alginate O-acetyltransferase complex protein AlgJ